MKRLKKITEWENIFATHITNSNSGQDNLQISKKRQTSRGKPRQRLEQTFYKKRISKPPINIWKGIWHH